jgi:hypothetical protein
VFGTEAVLLHAAAQRALGATRRDVERLAILARERLHHDGWKRAQYEMDHTVAIDATLGSILVSEAHLRALDLRCVFTDLPTQAFAYPRVQLGVHGTIQVAYFERGLGSFSRSGEPTVGGG